MLPEKIIKAVHEDLPKKVDKSDIVNDLSTGGSTKVLSAEQGKQLNTSLTSTKTKAEDWVNFKANGGTINGDVCYKTGAIYNDRNSSSGFFVTANQGKALVLQTSSNEGVTGDLVLVNSSEEFSFRPTGATGTNKVNLGSSGVSFKNLYLSEFNYAKGIQSRDQWLRLLTSSGEGIVIDTGSSRVQPTTDNGMALGNTNYKFSNLWLNSYNRSSNGYTKLPNGLILQWGVVDIAIPTDKRFAGKNISFPITFPNQMFVAFTTPSKNVTLSNASHLDAVGATFEHTSTTGGYITLRDFTSVIPQQYTFKVSWCALGY